MPLGTDSNGKRIWVFNGKDSRVELREAVKKGQITREQYDEEVDRQLAALEKDNQALKDAAAKQAAGSLRVSISDATGCVCVYGLSARFPVALYEAQWDRLEAFLPTIHALRENPDNRAKLAALAARSPAEVAAAKAKSKADFEAKGSKARANGQVSEAADEPATSDA